MDPEEAKVGMPKSGKPWKKRSKKATSKRFNKTTWDEKQLKRKEQKELRTIVQGIKEAQREKIHAERQRLKEKKKRDELNRLKSADLQLISNTKKIKKWSRKARQSLVKLPAELFEELLKKKAR